MKKLVIITLLLVVVAGGGYFAHQQYFAEKSIVMWDLVPADALLVYEKSNCTSCINELTRTPVGKISTTVGFYNKGFDSLQAKLSRYFRTLPEALVSLHDTKKDDLDLVFYLPAPTSAIDSLFRSSGTRRSREFNGTQIQELVSGKMTFSFAKFGEVWVASFSSILLEDVIRTFRQDNGGFSKRYKNVNGYSAISDDGGNLYVNLSRFDDLLSLFAGELRMDVPLGKSAALDIKYEGGNVILNGFAADTTSQLLSLFTDQSPVPFGLKHLITSKTIALRSFGVTNPKKMREASLELMQRVRRKQYDSLIAYSQTLKASIELLPETIADEWAIVEVESSLGVNSAKIILLESNSLDTWHKTFKAIANKLSIDTVFYERYGQYEIREVPIFEFPNKLLFPFVSGFKQTYYTSLNNVMIMAEDVNELKSYLDDVEAEDTWGKSVSQNRFLESTLLEANVSIYLNMPKVWRLIQSRLHPRWQSFLRENPKMTRAFAMTSIQFSHLTNSHYVNAVFTSSEVKTDNDSKDLRTITFDHGLRNLYAVRSHVNRAAEVLVQDSLNNLMLVGEEGKVLWKRSIGDPIISEVSQVDFFNNGKLQYAFATTNGIHVIDRLGEYVKPFPMIQSGIEIEYFSIVDYDNSKRYRFLVSDKKGKVWMYDKEGNPLDGWSPKQIGGPLAASPRHHRIKGKDYIVAIRKDGFVVVSNRRGENLRRFPLNTESEPSGNYIVELGSNLAQTYFVFISRDGFRVRFNVEGKLQSKEALLKTSVTSNFSLIADKTLKRYLILQQDSRQLILSDASGKRVLAIPASVNVTDIKYVDVGSGRSLIGVRDRTQNYTYIYELDGTLLTSPPIESWGFDIRPAQSGSPGVYFFFEDKLTVQPL